MKRVCVPALVAILVAGLLSVAGAASFTGTFPSDNSTVITGMPGGDLGTGTGAIGYFWSAERGDSVSETFTDTGLASVNQLDLNFDVTENYLVMGYHIDWDVQVNGTSVGSWTWANTDGVGTLSKSYAFDTIEGSGDYTVAMLVTNELTDAGSIVLMKGGSATLYSPEPVTPTVPEPSSMLMLVSGLGGLGALRLRRRR